MKTAARKKEFGEVFTPPPLVEEILVQIPPEIWLDPNETIIDPSGCGWGNFLIGVKQRLLQHHSIENILPRVFGVDIMEDNCIETILRLHFNFPLYNDDGTVNEKYREKLIEESEKASNGTSDYVEVIRLKNIVKDHYRYYAPKDVKKLEKHESTLDHLAYSNTIKRFLRPGLLALFLNKKTGKIIETIVQADGLAYDYSFGDRAMTPREVYEVREENKPVKTFKATVFEEDSVFAKLNVLPPKKPKKAKQKAIIKLDILKEISMTRKLIEVYDVAYEDKNFGGGAADDALLEIYDDDTFSGDDGMRGPISGTILVSGNKRILNGTASIANDQDSVFGSGLTNQPFIGQLPLKTTVGQRIDTTMSDGNIIVDVILVRTK